LSSIAAGPGNGGQLQVVLLGLDGNAYLLWQDNNQNWTSGIPTNPPQYYLPNPDALFFTSVVTGVGNDSKKLQVILLSQKEQLAYLIWQDTTGSWYWYGQLPSSVLPQGVTFSALATGIGNGGRLQVFALGTDGRVYLIWQDVDGTWHPYQDGSGNMLSLL
jgi:hypothetical protein